jgi:MFS family permease
MSADADPSGTVETQVPARMDRLPWARWHWMVIFGLGTVWILDGLEVTIVGAIGSRLTEDGALGISEGQLGFAGTLYIIGACVGALFWGYLTDRLGRKRLFLMTLVVYLLAVVATAFAESFLWFGIARFFTGFGIGGEYAAINSAIDELIPARARGWVDLSVNGSYWLGAAVGAGLSGVLLDTSIFGPDTGWRVAFGIGAVMAVAILIVRRHVPESPRWMTIHGKEEEAERLVSSIEDRVRKETGEELPEPEGEPIELAQRKSTGFIELGRTLFSRYPRRSLLGFTLLATQAFLYNGVLFTFSIVLTTFFAVSSSSAGLYLIPFGIANFLGALTLGRLFDTVGRREMIAGTYLISAIGIAALAILFERGTLGLTGFMVLLCASFFFASAAASAGYLTVSEIFPIETRAMAIAFFYAISTGIGGAVGPILFGSLIGTGDRGSLMWGYLGAAVLMAIAAAVALRYGIAAEQESLEDVAEPLAAEEAREQKEDEQEQRRRGRRRGPKRPAGPRRVWAPQMVSGPMPMTIEEIAMPVLEVPRTPEPDQPTPDPPAVPDLPDEPAEPPPDGPGVPEPSPPREPDPGSPDVPSTDPKGPET